MTTTKPSGVSVNEESPFMKPDILRSPAHNGVYGLPQGTAESLVAEARDAGFVHVRVNGSACHNLRALLRALGEQAAFPEWYGGNLDALHDCLIDPEWHPGQMRAKGYLLILSGLEELARKHPEDLQRLLEVFRSAAVVRRNDGVPFWLFAEGAGNTLATPPV